MSAGIERSDYIYLGSNTAAWHNLFEPVPGNASLAEIKKAAKLEWDPVKYKTYYQANGVWKETGGNLVACSDNSDIILTRDISDGFKFHYVDDLLGMAQAAFEAEDFEFETAGSLEGRKRIFLQAKTKEAMFMAGDKHYPFVGITTRNDGTGATIAKEGATRMVCCNTVSMFLGENTPEIRFSHVGNTQKAIEEARGALRRVKDRHLIMAKIADELQSKKLDRATEATLAEQIAKMAYPDPPKKYNDPLLLQAAIEKTQQRRTIARNSIRMYSINELQQAGESILNGWLFTQAVGEFLDTDYIAMSSRGGAETRFKSIMGGGVQKLKEDVQVLVQKAA